MTPMQELIVYIGNNIYPYEKVTNSEFTDKVKELLVKEEKAFKDAIMYALDEDGHTGDWKIRFADDFFKKMSSIPNPPLEPKMTWDEIEEEYSKDEYPVFGGPFTNALNPWEWLKLNCEPPAFKNKSL